MLLLLHGWLSQLVLEKAAEGICRNTSQGCPEILDFSVSQLRLLWIVWMVSETDLQVITHPPILERHGRNGVRPACAVHGRQHGFIERSRYVSRRGGHQTHDGAAIGGRERRCLLVQDSSHCCRRGCTLVEHGMM